MSFKFVAKNRETGLVGSVTVKADREQVARERLSQSGYEIVRLVRISNGQESRLRYSVPVARSSVSQPHAMSRPPMKLGLVARLQRLVGSVERYICYG